MGWEQSTLLLRTLESEEAITQESRNGSGRPQLRPAARGPAGVLVRDLWKFQDWVPAAVDRAEQQKYSRDSTPP